MTASDESTFTPVFRYWAFISYSHEDASWARWLEHALESYRIPKALVGKPTPVGPSAPSRFHPVFRDRSELPASAQLGAKIEDALRQSLYLIVVCSPNAVKSKWVNSEIEAFHASGREGFILALNVEGDPGENGNSLPPALKPRQPIAGDVRDTADGKSDAKLKILAGMLGIGFDSLKQRDASRRRRSRVIWASLVLGLITCSTLLIQTALLQSARATLETEKAKKSRLQSDRSTYTANIAAADRAIEMGDVAEARRLLNVGPISFRGWEWQHLAARVDSSVQTMEQLGKVDAIAMDSGGTRLAVATPLVARILTTSNWNVAATFFRHKGSVNAIAFNPLGTKPFRDSHGCLRMYKSVSGVLSGIYPCTFLCSTPLSWGCETILSSRWLPSGLCSQS